MQSSLNHIPMALEFKQEDLSKFIGIQQTMASVNVCSMEEAVRNLEEIDSNNIRYRKEKYHPSIKIGKCLGLDGKERTCVLEVADGSIITLFDKTPYPKMDTDVVCPHFLELKWANGCNFNCSWCYLNGTLRFRPMGKKPYLKDKAKIIEHIDAFIANVEIPSILNSGELSDSLVFEGKEFSLSKDIIPLFQNQSRHRLLILTKSSNVKGILVSNAQDTVIASFSINGSKVAKQWEKGAPSPIQRINSAKKLHDAGFQIRIRIDPIVPIQSWEEDYQIIIDHLFSKITPERITLGSLRGLRSTLNNTKDRSWVRHLDEQSNWGLKISFNKRLEIYSYIIDYLKETYSYQSVALCKESIEVWQKLGLDYKAIKCNCIQ